MQRREEGKGRRLLLRAPESEEGEGEPGRG